MSTSTSTKTTFATATIAGIEHLCDDAVAITFGLPADRADDFVFRSGQSLTIRLWSDPVSDRIVPTGSEGLEEVRRSYSICSPEGGPLRVGVREVPGGKASTWFVRHARVGDQIELGSPSGSFTADLSTGARHVLIGAGSGITPLLSVASTALKHPSSHVALLYGNRHANTTMFADEIADLKDAHLDRFRIMHVLSREEQDVELFNGRIDPDRVGRILPLLGPLANIDHWWLCGPYDLVIDVMETLTSAGVSSDRIHRELFFVEDEPRSDQGIHLETPVVGARVTAMLDGRSTSAVVAAGEPILDGLQRVRPDLPFACKGGVCGTCRAKVTEGEVTMRRNFALEPWEVQAGFVLTCQSLCQTDTVHVTFDA